MSFPTHVQVELGCDNTVSISVPSKEETISLTSYVGLDFTIEKMSSSQI